MKLIEEFILNKNNRKNNFAALAITLASSFLVAQEEVKKYEPILFQKGEEYVVPFKHKERKFNDWSVSFGAGIQ